MKKTADVVIIGGGITGAAIAYYLARAGVHAVVLERSDIAKGATGASGGSVGILPTVMGMPEMDLALLSWDLYHALPEEMQTGMELRNLGGICILRSENKLAVAKGILAQQKAVKQELRLQNQDKVLAVAPFELLSTDDIRAREPFMDVSSLIGGLYFKQKGHVNPYLAAHTFANAAKALGAAVYLQSEVTDIRLGKNGVKTVVTPQGAIETRFVVNAAGAWTPEVGKMVGVEIPIFPRKGQEVITEPIAPIMSCAFTDESYLFPPTKERTVITSTLHLNQAHNVHFVIKQTKHGGCLLGVSSENAGFDASSKPEVVREIVVEVLKYFPVLKKANLLRAFAGIRPHTPDGVPILSTAEEVEGFIVATGGQTQGITQGAAVGQLITELITGVKTSISLEPFSLARFKQPLMNVN